MGVISGCGSTLPTFSSSLYEGTSSLAPVTRFSTETYPLTCKVASEVKDFDPKPWFDNIKSIKSNDRYTHFAVAASKLALEDAGVPVGGSSPSRGNLGVMIGSAFGGAETFEREAVKLAGNPGRPKVSPFTIPALLGNTASGVVGIECGAEGEQREGGLGVWMGVWRRGRTEMNEGRDRTSDPCKSIPIKSPANPPSLPPSPPSSL